MLCNPTFYQKKSLEYIIYHMFNNNNNINGFVNDYVNDILDICNNIYNDKNIFRINAQLKNEDISGKISSLIFLVLEYIV